MNDKRVEQLYQEILSLTLDQQLYILERLFTEVLLAEPEGQDLTITGLRGLGKETWQGIDAQEYVDKERNSWS